MVDNDFKIYQFEKLVFVLIDWFFWKVQYIDPCASRNDFYLLYEHNMQ